MLSRSDEFHSLRPNPVIIPQIIKKPCNISRFFTSLNLPNGQKGQKIHLGKGIMRPNFVLLIAIRYFCSQIKTPCQAN